MSLRAVWRALQSDKESRWRLFAVPVLAVLAWVWWLVTIEGALLLGSVVAGGALGYAFAHGQTKFRQRLSSIGFWAFGAGAGLFILGYALRAASDGELLGKTVGGALLFALIIFLLCFGVTLRGEAKRL